MPLTNSVIRRYTPPTCTLQIVDRNSPLSRWVGRSVTSASQFNLRFDDPQLPAEKQVSIQGDRYYLEALHEAVTNYVQDLLLRSPRNFFVPPVAADPATALTPNMAEVPHQSEPVETTGAEPQPEAVLPQPQHPTTTGEIYLQPSKRGLTHNLFLGPLATEATGSVIQLSVLQLFDLATALDEYTTEVVALPTSSRSRRAAAPSGTWAGIAAALVLSVGITAVVVQLLNRSNTPPQVADRSAIPGATPSPLPPESTLEASPQLPALDPNNPTAATPNASLPGGNLPGIPSASPENPQANLPPIPPNPPNSLTPPSSVLVNPAPRQDGNTPPASNDDIPAPEFSISNVPNTIPSSLPRLSSPADNAANSEPNAAAAEQGEEPTTSATETNGTDATPPPAPTTAERLNAAIQGRPISRATPVPEPPQKTAYAPPPRVLSEAREFFQQRWQPPAGLTQTLEYSIVLDVDGTIQRIEPLGQASRTYVDRSGMPLIGERFVSPLNTSGQNPRIRVVLSPDGKVQTFAEAE